MGKVDTKVHITDITKIGIGKNNSYLKTENCSSEKFAGHTF